MKRERGGILFTGY